MNILSTCILTLSFQLLLLDSRPIISCHVSTVICLFVAQEIKEKRKNQIKENR